MNLQLVMKNRIFLLIQICFIFFTFVLPSTSSIHVFIFFFNLLIFILYSKNYYKGWYILSLTTYIYSLPHFLNYFLLGENILFTGLSGQFDFIANNNTLNEQAIRLVNIFILGLIIPSFFQKEHNIILEKDTLINKKILNSLLILFLLFLILALQKLDFKSVEDSYGIPIGSSLVFGIYYWINFVLSILFIYYLRFSKNMIYFIVFALILQLILFYLGVRQMTFWFIITIFLEFLLLSKINGSKINISPKIIAIVVPVIYVLGIITRYRVNKEISSDLLFSWDNFSAAYLGYLAETSLTFYNLLASIYESSKGNDMFFFPLLKDTLIMFIPAFLFPQKADYLTFSTFSESYNVNPFGTYFIVGELLLSLRYEFLVFIFGLLYNLLGQYFYVKFLQRTNILKLSVYVSTIVILFIRPVRGLLAPSIKIYITTVILIYILIKIGNHFISSKGKIL